MLVAGLERGHHWLHHQRLTRGLVRILGRLLSLCCDLGCQLLRALVPCEGPNQPPDTLSAAAIEYAISNCPLA
jgi:hypothetical protein